MLDFFFFFFFFRFRPLFLLHLTFSLLFHKYKRIAQMESVTIKNASRIMFPLQIGSVMLMLVIASYLFILKNSY